MSAWISHLQSIGNSVGIFTGLWFLVLSVTYFPARQRYKAAHQHEIEQLAHQKAALVEEVEELTTRRIKARLDEAKIERLWMILRLEQLEHALTAAGLAIPPPPTARPASLNLDED